MLQLEAEIILSESPTLLNDIAHTPGVHTLSLFVATASAASQPILTVWFDDPVALSKTFGFDGVRAFMSQYSDDIVRL